MFKRVHYFLILFLFAFNSSISIAHEVRPVIADITFMQDGAFVIKLDVNLEAFIAKIDAKHSNTNDSPNAQKYDQLRTLAPAELGAEYQIFMPELIKNMRLTFSDQTAEITALDAVIPKVGDTRLARLSVLHFKGKGVAGLEQVRFMLAPQFGNVAVKFHYQNMPAQAVHWVVDGRASPVFMLNQEYIARSWVVTAWTYIKLGFEHIVPKGVDHILFVLGLLFLSLRAKPLLLQVTAFTIAHSITLGLSIYGVVSLSLFIVEPLIAASIVYVGVENILRGRNSVLRLVVVFAFGLLHGLGFSAVLTDIGLPQADFLTALITFNIGVEFGQLMVIMLGMTLVYLLRLNQQTRYRRWVTVPGSALISLIGLYWFLERINFL